MSYLDAAARRNEVMINAIEADSNISKENKTLVHKLTEFKQAQGAKDRTISKSLYSLSIFMKLVGKRDLLKLSKEDIAKALSAIERSQYSPATKQSIKASIKVFYKHFLGEDEFYPKQISFIKATRDRTRKLMPEDILTEDEIARMIEVSNNLRDKALIALLFDSGARIGEIMNLRVKDVDLSTEPAHIRVNGKTGPRQIPIMFSAPFLADYLNMIKARAPNDYIWTTIGTWTNRSSKADYGAIRKVLKTAGQKAGIKKRIYPHLFRHSRATYYANKLTEQQLKGYMGWAADSAQASTYVHLSGRDIDGAVLVANGIKLPDRVLEPKLKSQMCPRCRYPNTNEAQYCNRCGSALDITTALNEDRLRNLFLQSSTNPKLVEEVIHEYLMEKYRKKVR